MPMYDFQSLLPANGTTIQNTNVTATVNAVVDTPGQYIYRLRVYPAAGVVGDAVYDHTITINYQQWYTRNIPGFYQIPNGLLTPGSWKFQADLSGSQTPTPAQRINTVTVVSSPTAVNGAPAAGAVLSWQNAAATTLPTEFSWTFTNANAQTAYQIEVLRDDTGAVVIDTGKVTSSATSAVINIPNTYKEVLLRWRVRVWGEYDNVSFYSTTTTFLPANAPVMTITAPTNNQVLNVGTPSVSTTHTTQSGIALTRITAELYDGVTQVWSKTVTSAGFASGQVISDNNFFMTPGVAYTYRVSGADSRGAVSAFATRNFTVSYTAPNGPNPVTATAGNFDTSGYVELSWSGANPDADFFAWEVEREDSLLDPNSGAVISTGPWMNVGRKYTNDTDNLFRDYLAPSGYRVSYRIRQVALKFNTEVLSVWTTSNSVDPFSSSYWLISGVNGALTGVSVIKLHNITADDYTKETERADFILMDRGRYSEHGTALGVRGQLTAQLRNSGGSTARIKRLVLEGFQDANDFCALRNPFGDKYQVDLGDLSIGRLAGTGRDEFVDVTIPYLEVTNL